MADLKISDLSALSGSDLVAADELAIVDDSASETKKITVSNLIANGVTLISDNAIPGAKILFSAGDIAGTLLADGAVTSAKIGADQVTAAKIADNTIVNIVSELPSSGDYKGQLALDTDDNSLYVYSGSAWLSTKAPGSINAFTDTTSGIINISTVVSSGTATVTASIDDTSSAAQFLAGPVGSAGAVGYRTIDGGDLPTATATSKGGVIVNGSGLTLSTDTIQIDNSVTASSTSHLVTYDANGLITGGAAISSTDLPIATGSARGAVVVSDGLAVDSSGNLSIDNSVTAGTYTKVTVTSKGVVSAGANLDAADIPDHSAAKLTSGTIGSSLIANDAVTAAKLADSSTMKFGGALGSDNVTIFPDGDFKGQLFWDETSLDLYLYSGSSFVPITVLSGNLVNAGTYNANTNLVSSVTTAGSSAGFSAGSALPAPTGANLNHYLVVDTSGTGSGAAPAVALAPPDMLLSNGVGTEYRLIDISNAIAGQTAANISFIASGTIAATDVQTALQEVDTEKLAIAGGTMTGDLNLGTSTNVVFEGSSADDYETTLTVANPTADRTITLPNITGTVVTTGDTGSVSSTMITNGTIVNADISASAEIAVSKLANGTARQLLQTDSGGSGVEFTSNVDVPGTLDVTSAATFDSTVDVDGLLSANGKLAYPAGSASAVSLYSGSDTDTGIYSPGSNQFGISTAGTSRVVVDASGRVLVGTTSDVSGGLSTTLIQGVATGGGYVGLGRNDTSVGNNDEIGGLRFYANDPSGYNDVGIIQCVADGTHAADDYPTRLEFHTTADGDSSPDPRMIINNSGNVAIGTTATTFTRATIVASNTATSISSDYNPGILNIQNSSATNGNLSLIGFQDASAFVNVAAIGSINDTHSTSPNSTSGSLAFYTKPTGSGYLQERLKINSSGQVGIGTSDPSHGLLTLSQSAASAFNALVIQQGNTGSTASDGLHIGIDSGVDAYITHKENRGIAFGTANQERMRVDSSGRLLVGRSTSLNVSGIEPHLQVTGTNGENSSIMTGRFSNDGAAPFFIFHKSRGADTATNVDVQENDILGRIAFYGADGADYEEAAHIQCQVDGAVATGGDTTDMPGRLVFATTENGDHNATERMRIDNTGNVHIGNTTNSAHTNRLLSVGKTDRSASYIEVRTSTSGDAGLLFSDGTGSGNEGFRGTVEYSHSSDQLFFKTAGDNRVFIDSSGNLLVGKTELSDSTAGLTMRVGGVTAFEATVASGNQHCMMLNRHGDDGKLISFRQANTEEGSITVSGSTVSYNGGHLARWSQLPGGASRTEILRGSVLSNLDEMCEWGEEDNEQLNRMQVSSVEGDRNVAGVFQAWDDNDDTYINDFYCAMTGDFVIRIAQGTTVERGDLLMSAGDGTAKPQDDDIVRSKTIAKVTSTTVSTTYSDGSYCIPCVLMAC
jgi:hypothetical protein